MRHRIPIASVEADAWIAPRPPTAALVKKKLSSNHHPPPLNCAPATLCQSAWMGAEWPCQVRV